MNIAYVVDIDVSSAVDQYGSLDDQAAGQIAYQCSGWPEGAAVRINIGAARYVVPSKLLQVLRSAGSVEITGSQPAGMRILGDCLNSGDPYLEVV